MRLELAALIAVAIAAIACEDPAPPTADATPAAPAPERVEPPAKAEAEAVTPEPEPEAKPEPPRFNPLTAKAARVRVLVAHTLGWSACGITHSVGAIEVEVLDVGEPPPRLVLYVSCPVDIGVETFAVGNVLDVRLHQRRQPWPRPRAELPEGVPVRYVSSLERVSSPVPDSEPEQ